MNQALTSTSDVFHVSLPKRPSVLLHNYVIYVLAYFFPKSINFQVVSHGLLCQLRFVISSLLLEQYSDLFSVTHQNHAFLNSRCPTTHENGTLSTHKLVQIQFKRFFHRLTSLMLAFKILCLLRNIIRNPTTNPRVGIVTLEEVAQRAAFCLTRSRHVGPANLQTDSVSTCAEKTNKQVK